MCQANVAAVPTCGRYTGSNGANKLKEAASPNCVQVITNTKIYLTWQNYASASICIGACHNACKKRTSLWHDAFNKSVINYSVFPFSTWIRNE